jgi:hypothetical protein
MSSERKLTPTSAKRQKGRKKLPSKRIASSSQIQLPITVSDDIVHSAVHSLLNNRITKVTESKDGNIVSHAYPAEILALAKGLFSSNKTYKFAVHNSSSIAATAGGSIAGTLSFTVLATAAPEWSALAALFDECRVTSYHFKGTTALGPVSASIPVTILLGYNPPNYNTGAASFNAVLRLPKTKQYHCYLGDGGSGMVHFSGKSMPRLFANTSSPYVISPPAGLLGSIDYCAYSSGTNSAVYTNYTIMFGIAFRCRA